MSFLAIDEKPVDDNFSLRSELHEKSAEVSAFIGQGMTFFDACRLVKLDPDDFITSERPIDFLPTPDEIEAGRLAIRRRDVAERRSRT